ncbi:MAG: DoxX family protein [Streptomyces sp.]|nr:DoxX family protein [Streptomyces sp.]
MGQPSRPVETDRVTSATAPRASRCPDCQPSTHTGEGSPDDRPGGGRWVARLIGGVELAAALGLILPATTGIALALTPLAAVGLAVVMVLAGAFHVRRGEYSAIGLNVVLALAVVVAWDRFGPYSF